jgi:hypothetical protein
MAYTKGKPPNWINKMPMGMTPKVAPILKTVREEFPVEKELFGKLQKHGLKCQKDNHCTDSIDLPAHVQRQQPQI